MDLRALAYFVHVAQLKSFSRAASQLRIAQPAISRQIRKLEDELGVTLFVRSPSGAELTQAGAQMLDRAEVLLRHAEQLRLDIMAEAREPGGPLTLAVTPATGPIIVPPLMARLKERFPQISLKVVEALTSTIHEGLLKDHVDLGLLYDADDASGLRYEPLVTEPLFVIGPATTSGGKGRAAPSRLDISDLESLPFLLPSRPNSPRPAVDAMAAAHGIGLTVVAEIDGMAIIKRLIAQGFGYGILNYGSVHDEVERGILTATPVGIPILDRQLALAYRAGRHPSKALIEVAALLRILVRELVTTGVWRGTLTAAMRSDPRMRGRR